MGQIKNIKLHIVTDIKKLPHYDNSNINDNNNNNNNNMSKTKVSDEIQINHEDQKKINSFANKNAKYNELKRSALNKKKELQLLEDAGDELLMVDDEDALIPVHIGEVFLHLGKDETELYIEETKGSVENELTSLDEQMKAYDQELNDLKVQLYAKFGTNINLEDEEET